MVYFAQGTSIYKLNPSSKEATLLALSGVTLTSVQMIRADGLGNLIVLDGNSGTTILRKIVLSTGVVSSIVSTISFNNAVGLAVSDSGNIYVTDLFGNKVVKLVLQNHS